ncbi:hypothetical protein DM02DRAFT_670962 [Periconia macrospinosa]|uniref:Uncharacterized protein n=1 Tax=Periconia macrospinosa TaxID=97972 RepID=A0A2V1DUC8_9PLEO|nr:hypothetical protein DM02DRAFT_670962 [Periconia macrospinosa]
MSITTLLLAILSTLATTAQGTTVLETHNTNRYRPICTLPICKSCPTTQQLTQPGIGFALGMEYGTAAIRYHNKTIQSIIQVQGSPAYLSLMLDLSHTTPQTRFPDEIPTRRGKLEYVRTRLQRLANKALGRPANAQTAVLAEMITQLKTSVEDTLSAGTSRASITHAVISSPDSIRLTSEELGDVLDYLKVTNAMALPDELFAASAAYAGFGHGLCAKYTDPDVCDRDENNRPYQRVLHLDFTNKALTTTIKGMRSWNTWGVDASVIIAELGYEHHSDDDDGPSDLFFDKIRDHIRNFTLSTRFRITELLFTGTRVGGQRFKDAVSAALRDLVAEDTMKTVEDAFRAYDEPDFVFVTAKGAAEVAKRRLEGPVRAPMALPTLIPAFEPVLRGAGVGFPVGLAVPVVLLGSLFVGLSIMVYIYYLTLLATCTSVKKILD